MGSTVEDAHTVLLMEQRGVRKYREKMLAEQKKHTWDMNLLERARKKASTSGRVEQARLVSRLDNINRRILEINKSSASRIHKRSHFFWSRLGDQPDVFKKQESPELQTTARKNQVTFLPKNSTEERPLHKAHLVSTFSTHSEPHTVSGESAPGQYQLGLPQNVSSKMNSGDKHSQETTTNDATFQMRPVSVRRKSPDPKVLASVLNVDESAVERQREVLQRLRLSFETTLKANNLADLPDKSDDEERMKPPVPFQRRGSKASSSPLHMPSDLLQVGFPSDTISGARVFPRRGSNDNELPAALRFVSKLRRRSMTSEFPKNHGKLVSGPRKVNTLSKPTTSTSFTKPKIVIEGADERLRHSKEADAKAERKQPMRNLVQTVISINHSPDLSSSLRQTERWERR